MVSFLTYPRALQQQMALKALKPASLTTRTSSLVKTLNHLDPVYEVSQDMVLSLESKNSLMQLFKKSTLKGFEPLLLQGNGLFFCVQVHRINHSAKVPVKSEV